MNWLRAKHPKVTVKDLRRRYLDRWWPQQDGVVLFNPATVTITRYRYRGAAIPSPWGEDSPGTVVEDAGMS
jgi:RNA-directed DNA polymerase